MESYLSPFAFCHETSDSRQDHVPNGDFSYRNAAHCLTETHLPPLFPRPPFWLGEAYLSGDSPNGCSGASRKKQTPSCSQMKFSRTAAQPQSRSVWSCGLVSVSDHSYESFADADLSVIQWLIYSESKQGIPLGCATSPALAANYLSPLNNAISKIPGVKYLRYMDDWIILCPSRWKMRRALKLMHQTSDTLGLRVHPDKIFIGVVSRGFDFLGVQFSTSLLTSRYTYHPAQRRGSEPPARTARQTSFTSSSSL